MKQVGHTWIAIRAIGLIQEDRKTQGLAQVLTPSAKHAHIGCWLPDMSGFKKGHGVVGNHTFKNTPYKGAGKDHFIVGKKKLLASLDPKLALHQHIHSSSSLTASWWKTPFKADQAKGEHLPSCVSSLHDTIADMLLLGNPELDALVPGETGYADQLHPSCALSPAQVAPFFTMLSHYVADCFMPCHADKRKLAAFCPGGLHEGWEKHWDKRIGSYFKKKKLSATTDTADQIIQKARDLDGELGLDFETPLGWPKNDDDMWTTAVMWCRASFALSCEVFPVEEYGYKSKKQPKFKGYFRDRERLEYLDRVVLQSAVYAVASTWKKIWRKFK